MKHIIPFIILFISICNAINAHKILYLLPFTSKSHMHVFEPLIQELAKRKHQITVVRPYTISRPKHADIREILLNVNDNSHDTFSPGRFFNNFRSHVFVEFTALKYLAKPSCESYLTNTEVRELLKNGKQFDVVVVDAILNECALATAPLLGKTVILHCPSAFPPWTPSYVPQLHPTSYVPVFLIAQGSKMNFMQRMANAVSFLVFRLIVEYDYIPHIQTIIAKHLPQNPSIFEGLKSVDFVITNSNPVITSPRPSVSILKDVGGMHCQKAESLPKELEDFIQSSGDEGFILFSFGSVARSKDLPVETIKSLLDGFSRLKQHVIWKFEEKLENVPKNVKISKWLPQKDLLGHSKIRLFITHGGMLSLQESIYNGVPVVIVPIFADQPGNVARVEEIGVGVKLALSNISGDSTYDAINKILGDKSYAENMRRYSVIFHEFIENQVEKAAYWVEYVIRHDGAHHLRSIGDELNFFQYFSVDIIAFLFIILSVVIFVVVKIGKFASSKL